MRKETRSLYSLYSLVCGAMIVLAMWGPVSAQDEATAPSALTPAPTSTIPSTVEPQDETAEPSTFTPTSTILPVITPTPTPVPQESESLRAGRLFQKNGDYDQAIAEYEAVLAGAGDEAEVKKALLLVGESYLANGDYPAAISILRRFLATYPGDVRRSQALFLLATSYEAAGEMFQAIEYYRRYLVWGDLIASYVHERLGRCHAYTGNYVEAIRAYRQALQDGASLDRTISIAERIAEIYFNLGNYARAVDWYDTLLTNPLSGYYRARFEYLAGQAYLAWGQADQAHSRFRAAVNGYPETRHAYLALIALVNAGVPVNEFQRGLVDYHNGAYEPAVDAFHRYIDSEPETRADEARYYAGLAYQAAGSYDLAVEELRTLIEDYPESEYLGRAWLAQAEALADKGDYEGAVSTYLEFVELHPDNSLAPEALWQKAQLAESRRLYEQAASGYLDLQTRFPQSDHGDEALFQAGLSYFRLARHEQALEAWGKLLSAYQKSTLRAKTFLWRAKSFQRLDNAQEAGQNLQEALSAPGESYYALRAVDLKRGGDPFSAAEVVLAQPTPAEQKELETWLLTWAQVPTGTTTAQIEVLGLALRSSDDFQRGAELLRVGLRDEALDALTALQDKFEDDPLALYHLALFCREQGLYDLSVFCAKDLVRLSPAQSVYQVPSYLQKLDFPVYFDDLVLAEAEELGLDPLLFFSLIRQESAFGARATSWADARGLTQVMPATGEWIASQLNWSDFQVADLYKPYLNLKFGAWYLTQQLRLFGGDPFAALAAYNGGPGRVARWREEEGASDLDLFVEIIPLSESHRFVKRIYENYGVYRTLYSK